MGKSRKTPWQRIKDAADAGYGCRLSADEIIQLSRDGAIMARAELDDEEEEEQQNSGDCNE